MRVFPLSFSVVFAHSRESDVRTVVVLAYRGHLLTGKRQMEITPQVAQNDTHPVAPLMSAHHLRFAFSTRSRPQATYPASNQKLTPTSCDFPRTAVKFHNGTKN